MKAVVHIGIEKTGTKTLQEFLHMNRARLSQQGLLYTRSAGKRNNRQLAVAAYPADRRDDATMRLDVSSDEVLRTHQRRIICDLAAEIDAHGGDRVLFSSEHLQSRLRTVQEIRRLKDDVLSSLGLHEIEVVVYLRDPAEICRSLYASAVATGSTVHQPPAPDNPYFETVCNHRRTLENWSSVFGAGAVRPRLFDRESWVENSLVKDFCSVSGIGFDERFAIPQDKNKSLSHLGLEILRRVNERIPRISEEKFNSSRSGLVALVRRYCKGERYVPLPELIESYRQHFAESNEWVRQQYFPERGDLFQVRAGEPPSRVQASESELDHLADLVVAAWTANTDTFEAG